MAQKAQFRVALHCLLHLSAARSSITSEELAKCVGTHAVVIRRTLAPLRDAGLLEAQGGRGGGWVLRKAPDAISMADIYDALGDDVVASWLGPKTDDNCEVRLALERGLTEARSAANAVIRESLARQRLVDVMPLS